MPGLDWSRMACQSVSVRSVGRAFALSYPYDLRSVACRMGGAWSGRVDKSNATQTRQGAGRRVAGSAQGP